jgi:hypothetical protein
MVTVCRFNISNQLRNPFYRVVINMFRMHLPAEGVPLEQYHDSRYNDGAEAFMRYIP